MFTVCTDKQGRRFILEIGTQPTLSTNDPTSPSDYYSCIDTNTTNTTTHTTELAEQTDLTDPSSSTAAVTQAQTAPKSWASLFKSNNINQQHNHHHKQHYNNAQPRTYKDFKDLIQNYRPSMQPRILEPRGFVNRGNMCFMNAILQPLVFCAPFYNLLSTIASTVPHSFGISKTPILDAL